MPRGAKSKYTDKQERKAEHIEKGYEHRAERGVNVPIHTHRCKIYLFLLLISLRGYQKPTIGVGHVCIPGLFSKRRPGETPGITTTN